MNNPIFKITLNEKNLIDRKQEPVTHGVPFPPGLIRSVDTLRLRDGGSGESLPMEAVPLSMWKDGSVKWALLDWQATISPAGEKELDICMADSVADEKIQHPEPIKFSCTKTSLSVRTGTTEFHVGVDQSFPFSGVASDGKSLLKNGTWFQWTDEKGRKWTPRVTDWRIESANDLKLLARFEGQFSDGSDVHDLRFISHLYFYAGKSTARMDFTLWNPKAAFHPGGVWDLGDEGSILFQELLLQIPVAASRPQLFCAVEPGNDITTAESPFLLYQDSSGGKNWQSRNHLNRNEKIPTSFKGFEIRRGDAVTDKGLRATPCMGVSGENGSVWVTLPHFWQNFPKALEYDAGVINVVLFPRYFNDLFELQGGERKTHTVYISAGQNKDEISWEWIHHPLLPQLEAEWYYTSGACPRPVPQDQVENDAVFNQYQNLIDIAVNPGNSFADRREQIDEYGWRNFGDIYADHESVFHKEPEGFISHYNNQYDVVKGGLVQFMRTGNPDWYRLAYELARHVADIDIYYTEADRFEFNKGMFWHTDHHLDAATASHRSFSRKHREFKPPQFVGGGPSHSHNYATGLMYLYWMTGEPMYKESAVTLADYMAASIEGSDILLENLFNGAKSGAKWLLKKLGKLSGEFDIIYVFNGPGRASGNALNTLIDGYVMTSEKKYMVCAEKLIRRCVSPDDDIESRDLLNAEFRWMYTIFFQALGRYLDVKREAGMMDASFEYARRTLVKYARWMVENERPYLDVPDILDFPNETWAAQDIRKSDVLAFAAMYAPDDFRPALMEKSRFFFQSCVTQLQNFDTCYYVRPIVILMCNGMVHMAAFSDKVGRNATDSWNENVPSNQENGVGRNILTGFTEKLSNTSLKKELDWLKRKIR